MSDGSELARIKPPVFKRGDRVRCVDEPDGTYGNVWAPVRGKTYEVACIAHDQLVHLRTEPEVTLSRGWQQERFELVEEAAPVPEWKPGDGWRRMRDDESLIEVGEYVEHTQGATKRYWVRMEPVPPLPTEPWTMIEVTFLGGDVDRWFLDKRRNWRRTVDGDLATRADLTGFEVLSKPPTTAWVPRSVLDRVRDLLEQTHQTVTLPEPVVRALTAAHREYATDQTRNGGAR